MDLCEHVSCEKWQGRLLGWVAEDRLVGVGGCAVYSVVTEVRGEGGEHKGQTNPR